MWQAKMQNYVIVSTVSVLILGCLAVSIQGKRQTEVLGRLYRSKFSGNSGINTNLFEAIDYINASNLLPQDGLKERDRIDRLPGQPSVGFSQFGGYVTVDKSAGRALYYYFVEARYSKQSLPLVLWLNGGPGCSSLAYGAMQELGPFRVYSDGKTLYKNKYSWNYAANVLFLESPAGVGFSYSNTTSDYKNSIGDRKTAEDNYVFLLNWLERFPEYKGRDFYMTGESYAGHYVPQLAHTILHHNTKAKKTIINLKGIMIGNAAIDDETDNGGMYDYLGTHAIISEEDARDVRAYCDFSSTAKAQSSRCDTTMSKIDKDTYSIDIYNLYAPICFAQSTTAKPRKTQLTEFDPCSDYYVYAYLNRPEVQEALHANVTKLTHDWEPCSDILGPWFDSDSTILPILQELMDSGLRVWLFSGDMDGRVPVTSTQYAIDAMKLAVKTRWHPWYIAGEVGGYTQEYNGNLTFATVRGAGHQVPSYQPLRALALVKHFLAGTVLPDTTRYS